MRSLFIWNAYSLGLIVVWKRLESDRLLIGFKDRLGVRVLGAPRKTLDDLVFSVRSSGGMILDEGSGLSGDLGQGTIGDEQSGTIGDSMEWSASVS